MWQQILHIDQQLLLALNGSWGGFWDTCFYIVTARLTWIPLYAAILYFAWRKIGTRNLLWMLVCLGVAVIAADQICNFFKHYTPKLRPSHTPAIEQFVHTLHGYRGGLYGTVSAHAAVSFTIAMFSARLFSRSWYSWTIKLWVSNRYRFSLMQVIRREYVGFFCLVLAFVTINLIRNRVIEFTWGLSPLWSTVGAITLLFTIFIRVIIKLINK